MASEVRDRFTTKQLTAGERLLWQTIRRALLMAAAAIEKFLKETDEIG